MTSKFRLVATTEAEEEAYDFVKERNHQHPSGTLGSVMNIVKGALGGGILSGHVAYKLAGYQLAIAFNLFFGIYMTYCLYILVISAQVLYKRTRVHTMSYPDVGEAAVACHPNPKISKWAKTFRHAIDGIVCLDLFGSCATYQIIIAKSLKQLVEDVHKTTIHGQGGYPDLRVYMAIMIPFLILVCLITKLKYLAPLSLVANGVILFTIFLTLYYLTQTNPGLEGLNSIGTTQNIFNSIGMIVFSMSCSGVVIPVENNMKNPKKYPIALCTGMAINILAIFSISFCGYASYLDKSESPITVNFPMTTLPKIVKGLIVLMIYVTHGVNFWVPFNIVYHYIKPRIKEANHYRYELVYRALFVIIIGLTAIIFPAINALMGFLGAFCLSNMAFIWPTLIDLLVVSHRPGLGKYKWRLWKSIFLMVIGMFLLIVGTTYNTKSLIEILIRGVN